MNIFRDLGALPSFENSVVTIGTYDGVHIGHQKIIKRINAEAKRVGGESILVTFHPHPRTIVNENVRVPILSPLEEKLDLLNYFGVQNVVVVPFNRRFSEQSPEDYIEQFLVKNFTPNKIIIGYDHKFGKNRKGDIHLLKEKAKENGFLVEEISKQEIQDIGISSTKIRKAIGKGEIILANELLGHNYSLRGVVVKGQQLGRQIGFPTANIQVNKQEKLIPLDGVYGVTASFLNKKESLELKGMLNIGTRPTVNGKDRTIEVHLFDFNGNIYGDLLEIKLLDRIRAEKQFPDLQALVKQLELDKEACLKKI